MKLSKKVLAVLVSMNFLFSSIAFGTGTSKLEPVYLANVAQYMPMAEEIKLEQVSKKCAEGLKMGRAYDFLICYILLNTLPKDDEYEFRILSDYSDFEIADKAFKNSIACYHFKPGAKITGIPEKYRALCSIKKYLPRTIIFPRAYNLSFEDVEALVELYNNLDGTIEIQRDQKDFIRTHIFDNREYTTSEEDILALEDLLNTGLLLNLQKLERDLHDKLDFNADNACINTMSYYFSLDKLALIDSVPQMYKITTSMLGIDVRALNEYIFPYEIQEGLPGYDMFTMLYAEHRIYNNALLALLDCCGFIPKDQLKGYLRRIKELGTQCVHGILYDGIRTPQTIRDLYQPILTELQCNTDFVDTRKTKYEVFKGYLSTKGKSLPEKTLQFLYLFFCEEMSYDIGEEQRSKHPKACKLRDIKDIIDELVEKTRIIQTDFNEGDIEYPAIGLEYSLTSKKERFEKYFSKKGKDIWFWRIECMLPLFQIRGGNDTIDLDALQTVVYIVHKIGCSRESIDNMYAALIKHLQIDEPESLKKIKMIFTTVRENREVDLNVDLGTAKYSIKRDVGPTSFRPTLLLGGVALGVTGDLLYNGIKKYKNTSKANNISKTKNNKNINKNINKKILRNNS